jgi:hypothetical protein
LGQQCILLVERSQKEEGRRKKFGFEMGILTPTQNKQRMDDGVLNPYWKEIEEIPSSSFLLSPSFDKQLNYQT